MTDMKKFKSLNLKEGDPVMLIYKTDKNIIKQLAFYCNHTDEILRFYPRLINEKGIEDEKIVFSSYIYDIKKLQ